MKNLIKKMTAPIAGSFALATLYVGDTMAFFDRQASGPSVARTDTLGTGIVSLLNYFLGLLGLIAVAFLIYAGVLMVTAGGAEEQVTKAKKIIMFAVAGIVIIILSFSIVTFVTDSLTS